MKLIDYNNSSSLVIDNIKKVGNRVNFSIAVFLLDKRNDTNIRFETESFVEIDEWQQKGETLLSDHKLELENFSFHAVLDQMYSWDNHIISNYNFFELSNDINKSHLKCMIESADVFGKEFIDEINDVILYYPDGSDTAPQPSQRNGLIHIKQKIVGIYEGGEFCSSQLEVSSDNFRMIRVFDDFYNGIISEPDDFLQFKNNKLDRLDIGDLGGVILRVDLSWRDDKAKGEGSIYDWGYPEHNELTFDYYVEVEWENVEESSLPIISYVTNIGQKSIDY